MPVSSAPVAVLLVAASLAPVLLMPALSGPAAVSSGSGPDRYLQSSRRLR